MHLYKLINPQDKIHYWRNIQGGPKVSLPVQYFFGDTITVHSYLNMPRDPVIPELQNSTLFEGTEII